MLFGGIFLAQELLAASKVVVNLVLMLLKDTVLEIGFDTLDLAHESLLPCFGISAVLEIVDATKEMLISTVHIRKEGRLTLGLRLRHSKRLADLDLSTRPSSFDLPGELGLHSKIMVRIPGDGMVSSRHTSLENECLFGPRYTVAFGDELGLRSILVNACECFLVWTKTLCSLGCTAGEEITVNQGVGFMKGMQWIKFGLKKGDLWA